MQLLITIGMGACDRSSPGVPKVRSTEKVFEALEYSRKNCLEPNFSSEH